MFIKKVHSHPYRLERWVEYKIKNYISFCRASYSQAVDTRGNFLSNVAVNGQPGETQGPATDLKY